MSHPSRKKLVWLVVVVVAGLLAAGGWLGYRWLNPTFVPPALPSRNGYGDLLRAAEMLHPRTDFHDEMEAEELADVVAHNEPALAVAGEALEKQIGVPVDWTQEFTTAFEAVLPRMEAMRSLSRAHTAALRQDIAEGNGIEAVSKGLATFRLGNECYRGGLLVEFLVGVAVQGVAVNDLRQVAQELPETREAIIAGLLPLLDKGEPIETVIRREEDYVDSSLRGLDGLVMRLNFRTLQQLKAPAIKAAHQAAIRTKTQQRLFLLHLAVNLYHDRHGKWPEDLSDLAPDILPVVFEDSYSKSGFAYRVEGEGDDRGYQLYSVGSNGKDDGGTGDETGLGLDFIYDFSGNTLSTDSE